MKRHDQPSLRLVRRHPEGEVFSASQYVGECPAGDGRLQYGAFVVRRGDLLYHPSCDPKPMIAHCICGAGVKAYEWPGLCDECWAVWYALQFAWWKPDREPLLRASAFGVTKDTLPAEVPWLLAKRAGQRVRKMSRVR